jgi:hypothetical protein
MNIFKLALKQPIYNKFLNLKSYYWNISEYKGIELNFYFNSSTLIDISLDFRGKKEDHAGIQIELGVLGFEINLQIYDSRHNDDYK